MEKELFVRELTLDFDNLGFSYCRNRPTRINTVTLIFLNRKPHNFFNLRCHFYYVIDVSVETPILTLFGSSLFNSNVSEQWQIIACHVDDFW